MLAGLQPANERIVALWLNASCKVSTPTEKHRVAVACALQGDTAPASASSSSSAGLDISALVVIHYDTQCQKQTRAR